MQKEFYYHIYWRSRGVQLGPNRTRISGGNAEFQSYVPFLENPNPMRIDVMATLKTVPRQIVSRSYYENVSIPVYAVVDMSASMRFVGQVDKLRLVAEMIDACAWSVLRNGDAFGLLTCDNPHKKNAYHPATRNRTTALRFASKILTPPQPEVTHSKDEQFSFTSTLPEISGLINQKKALVFVISDFHLPETTINKTFKSLSAHDVVPIVIWDSAEMTNIPEWGWANLRDMETGGHKSIFLRPALSKKIKQAYLARRDEIKKQCTSAGTRPPFFIEDQFKAQDFTRHLLESI